MKFKVVAKWTAIFLVLAVWTVIVVKGVPMGSVQLVQGADVKNEPIYFEENGSFTQVTKSDLLDVLFNKNFVLTHHETFVPSSQYSIRAKSSDISLINDVPGQGKNEFSLNVNDKTQKSSRGSLVIQQNDGTRVSLDLDGVTVEENTADTLKLAGNVKGMIDRSPVSGKVRVHVDKNAQTVTVMTYAGVDVTVEDMPITLCQFCGNEMQGYYVLEVTGPPLTDQRGITDVRDELNDNPIILENFVSLTVLNKPAWVNFVPDFVS